MSRFDEKFQKRASRCRYALKIKARGKLRLSVFRSERNISAQLIDDEKQVTLCAASSLEKSVRDQIKNGGNVDAAKIVGKLMGEKILKVNVDNKPVVFDKSGYRYHGRVKCFADAVREAGVKF